MHGCNFNVAFNLYNGNFKFRRERESKGISDLTRCKIGSVFYTHSVTEWFRYVLRLVIINTTFEINRVMKYDIKQLV